jgi:hypothetical protein
MERMKDIEDLDLESNWNDQIYTPEFDGLIDERFQREERKYHSTEDEFIGY